MSRQQKNLFNQKAENENKVSRGKSVNLFSMENGSRVRGNKPKFIGKDPRFKQVKLHFTPPSQVQDITPPVKPKSKDILKNINPKREAPIEREIPMSDLEKKEQQLQYLKKRIEQLENTKSERQSSDKELPVARPLKERTWTTDGKTLSQMGSIKLSKKSNQKVPVGKPPLKKAIIREENIIPDPQPKSILKKATIAEPEAKTSESNLPPKPVKKLILFSKPDPISYVETN